MRRYIISKFNYFVLHHGITRQYYFILASLDAVGDIRARVFDTNRTLHEIELREDTKKGGPEKVEKAEVCHRELSARRFSGSNVHKNSLFREAIRGRE